MKKQKTFADRAKEIKKRYPRAEWDSIERKDMMKELEALREEQEEYKTAVGIAEGADEQDKEEEEMKRGGYVKNYLNGGGDARDGFVPQRINTSGIKTPITGYDTLDNSILQPAADNTQFRSPKASFLPFALSGAASMIVDIAGLSNLNKNSVRSIDVPRIAPSNISLQPQREALQRSYSNASNVMLRNSRDVGSPANAYSNQIAGISGLTDSLGTQMGQSMMNEANTNAQMQARVNEQNAQMGFRGNMVNAELQNQYAQNKGQFINSMSQTIPMMFRDYRAQSMDQNMVNNMGKDYGQYEQVDPNEKPMDKLRRMLFGTQTYTKNREGIINNGR